MFVPRPLCLLLHHTIPRCIVQYSLVFLRPVCILWPWRIVYRVDQSRRARPCGASLVLSLPDPVGGASGGEVRAERRPYKEPTHSPPYGAGSRFAPPIGWDLLPQLAARCTVRRMAGDPFCGIPLQSSAVFVCLALCLADRGTVTPLTGCPYWEHSEPLLCRSVARLHRLPSRIQADPMCTR